MPIRIDYRIAEKRFREAHKAALKGEVDPDWLARVEELARLCSAGASTHLAFFVTEVLAKSVDPNVDLFYIKPTKAPPERAEKSYSARPLSERVIVPLSAELDIDIGATGPQPLNNQPYFRMNYLGDQTPVHGNSRPAFKYMLSLIDMLEPMTANEAMSVLIAFISARKNAAKNYATFEANNLMSVAEFGEAISNFVSENTEGGKRAQAVMAGICDACFGEARVETGSGRINDPSRKRPGDVCILGLEEKPAYERAYEVKDKPVSRTDVQLFVRNSMANYSVWRFGYVAVASNQTQISEMELAAWASNRGASIQIYYDWESILSHTIFWGKHAPSTIVSRAINSITKRLKEIEVAEETIKLWAGLVGIS